MNPSTLGRGTSARTQTDANKREQEKQGATGKVHYVLSIPHSQCRH